MAKQGDRAILSDATGSILAFQPTGTFNIGDQVRVAGAISVYSNEYQFNKPTITKIGEGKLSYPDENLITTDAPLTAYAVGDPSTVRVTYATLRGVVDESGNLVIGNKTVTVYSALTSLKGKTVDAVGYLVGWYKNNNNVLSIYFVKVSASEYVDPNAPIASVDPTSKTWAYNEVDAATFAVTATNCTWDYSPKTLSWASITADANGITVTPNGEAGTSADNTGTITVTFTNTNSGYDAIDPVEISLTQTKAPAHGITVNPSTNPIVLSGTANTPYTVTINSNYAWTASSTGTGFVVTPTSGDAGETIVTIKPSNNGGNEETVLGSVSFTESADNTVTSSFTVKQAKYSETVTSTTKLTNANIVAAGNGGSGYDNYTLTDGNGYSYSAYAIKNYHSKATSSYHYLQIKKYSSSTAYYIQLPVLGTKIKSITMTVSSTQKPMTDGENLATLFFSSSNKTSASGNGVVSGTGTSTVTLDASSLNLNTGYITADAGVRIWDIEITYEHAAE
jgi:hypothetical protein